MIDTTDYLALAKELTDSIARQVAEEHSKQDVSSAGPERWNSGHDLGALQRPRAPCRRGSITRARTKSASGMTGLYGEGVERPSLGRRSSMSKNKSEPKLQVLPMRSSSRSSFARPLGLSRKAPARSKTSSELSTAARPRNGRFVSRSKSLMSKSPKAPGRSSRRITAGAMSVSREAPSRWNSRSDILPYAPFNKNRSMNVDVEKRKAPSRWNSDPELRPRRPQRQASALLNKKPTSSRDQSMNVDVKKRISPSRWNSDPALRPRRPYRQASGMAEHKKSIVTTRDQSMNVEEEKRKPPCRWDSNPELRPRRPYRHASNMAKKENNEPRKTVVDVDTEKRDPPARWNSNPELRPRRPCRQASVKDKNTPLQRKDSTSIASKRKAPERWNTNPDLLPLQPGRRGSMTGAEAPELPISLTGALPSTRGPGHCNRNPDIKPQQPCRRSSMSKNQSAPSDLSSRKAPGRWRSGSEIVPRHPHRRESITGRGVPDLSCGSSDELLVVAAAADGPADVIPISPIKMRRSAPIRSSSWEEAEALLARAVRRNSLLQQCSDEMDENSQHSYTMETTPEELHQSVMVLPHAA